VPETMNTRPVKKDWLLAGALSVLTLASRIPMASHFLFNSDSTRMALAMEHFDVSQMRPHAPGYILYVACAKLVDFFVRDAAISLVSVSILASALTVAVLYLLSFRMYDRTNAILSSVLLATSPLFWFNGEMALTYALEGFFCTLLAYVCYLMVKGEKEWTVVSALLLGVATGIRQNVIIFFLPLWLFSLRKFSFKRVLGSFLVYGLVCLAWFFPLVTLSGGLSSYLRTLNAQFASVVLDPAPFLFQVRVRSLIFAKFMLASLSLGIIPQVYYLGRFFRLPSTIQDQRRQVILLWILPAILFYIAVTLFNPGQVIVILPPLFIFMSESLMGLARDVEAAFIRLRGIRGSFILNIVKPLFSYRSVLVLSAGMILVVNGLEFFLMRTPACYAVIEEGDTQLAERIRLTRENTAAEKTIILACLQNTQAAYYLPDRPVYCPFPIIFPESKVPLSRQNVYISYRHRTEPRAYWIPTDFRIAPIPIPDGIDSVVIWEKDLADYYRNEDRPLLELKAGDRGASIYLLQVNPGEKILYHYHHWTVQ
jgi:hypothetical protein